MNISADMPRATGLPGSARTRTILITAAIAIVIAAVAFIVDQPTANDGLTAVTLSDATGQAPQVGQAAPDFTITTTDGTPVKLSDLKGKAVWLTFGASWCSDCRGEAADLEATYAKLHPQGLVVLQVSISEDTQAVKDYAGRAGLTFTMAADPETQVASAYHVLGIPTHYFIGKDGTIRTIRMGGLPPADMEQLAQSVMG